MIYGIGTDVCDIRRIAASFARHGERFAQRILGPNELVVFDLFPKDKETACYADMTRTYFLGDPPPEVQEWHRLVKEALDRSTAEVRAGANGRKLYELVCDIFQDAGYKTQLNKEPGEVLEVLATDPGADHDFRAWCRRTGHVFEGVVEEPGQGPLLLDRAMHEANSRRPGPVLVEVPVDVLRQEVAAGPWPSPPHREPALAPPPGAVQACDMR